MSTDYSYLTNLSPYQLAGMADCGFPNTSESPGADILTHVRDRFVENIEYVDPEIDPNDDSALFDAVYGSEIADSGPNIYTSTMWQEFADLCGYQEDPTELGFDGSDMEQGARICLYMIAERLVWALISRVMEELTDGEE